MLAMLEALFKSLEVGLGIWQSKEKTKYMDKVSNLKRTISDEEAKDLSIRDQNVIDRAYRDLLLIVDQWSAEVAGSHSPDKS